MTFYDVPESCLLVSFFKLKFGEGVARRNINHLFKSRKYFSTSFSSNLKCFPRKKMFFQWIPFKFWSVINHIQFFPFLLAQQTWEKNIRKPKLEKSLLLITINFEFKKFLNESFDVTSTSTSTTSVSTSTTSLEVNDWKNPAQNEKQLRGLSGHSMAS